MLSCAGLSAGLQFPLLIEEGKSHHLIRKQGQQSPGCLRCCDYGTDGGSIMLLNIAAINYIQRAQLESTRVRKPKSPTVQS